MAIETVEEWIEMLKKHDPKAYVRISVSVDADPDSEDERFFCEDGPDDCFAAPGEVTICMVGKSNLT